MAANNKTTGEAYNKEKPWMWAILACHLSKCPETGSWEFLATNFYANVKLEHGFYRGLELIKLKPIFDTSYLPLELYDIKSEYVKLGN
ncbi:hypothetical protein GH714_012088 [Hevea brasiliensis]|uniref:Uncharacterized protein n=1 Tax=Hevea brasiliensis TaxID=3981 RepID=A0A6A6N312_HEVBR|nr:hypothetical protein GH714_012023 [Hevea brasiliensis]KAF2318976.1 hypothetical protein GH714_012088 [Hevea brasiliensis]